MVIHEADSYSDSGVTIEVNGGARGEEDYSSSGPGVAGSGGQIIPVSSLHFLFLCNNENVPNSHMELHDYLRSIVAIRLAIWDMASAVVIISMERPILMPSVHLAYAAALTRCVDVQMTVIVLLLTMKCATQLTTSATLVLCLMVNLAQQKMVMMLILAVLLAYAAVLTRCVDVLITVIVLQVKCATSVTTSATLVVYH